LSQFETQSNSLQSLVAGQPADAIAIGHSNGGIVSRQANEDGRSWRGIVTIGTGHTGFPIAGNITNGLVWDWARYIAISVSQPFYFYGQFYPDEWAWWVAARLGRWAYTFALTIPGGLAGLGFEIAAPVLGEMPPGTAYFDQNLNSAANLDRESAALGPRIGITSTVRRSYGLFFQAVAPDNYQRYARVQYLAGGAFYAAGFYYENYVDPYDPWYWEKTMNAWMWYQAGDAMFNADQDWCYLIGAYSQVYACIQNDAVVPTWRMPYPGGTRTVDITGPAHIQETRDGYTAIADVLQTDFGVAPRPAPSVSISGTSTIKTVGDNNWTCNASGGNGNYSYSWERSDAGGPYYWVGGSATYGSWVDQSNGPYFDLRCTVTSGSQSQANKRVNVIIP
jgi:hypothetical protein